MRTDELDYTLPDSRIAQRPLTERDASRLLVVHRERFEHRTIADWPSLVPARSLVVVNDTRVIRARLLGRRAGTGGRVELLLLAPADDEPLESASLWRALGRANRPLRVGAELRFGGLSAQITDRDEDGTCTVRLSSDGSVLAALDADGAVPIPPYIRRPADGEDTERYQTVYARYPGSVAAPTAGLHLTEGIRDALRARGVRWASLTLHVGLGTFRPVEVEELENHPMHEESIVVDEVLAQAIAETRAIGGAVIAVGTTVVRALESARDASRPGHVVARRGTTRLLIQPGYRFGVVDGLLTNFHQPRSTLLALVGAFGGMECIRAAYQEALDGEYRFLSYGDAMWLPERTC